MSYYGISNTSRLAPSYRTVANTTTGPEQRSGSGGDRQPRIAHPGEAGTRIGNPSLWRHFSGPTACPPETNSPTGTTSSSTNGTGGVGGNQQNTPGITGSGTCWTPPATGTNPGQQQGNLERPLNNRDLKRLYGEAEAAQQAYRSQPGKPYVDGSSGPFKEGRSGDWGRNTAVNIHALRTQDPNLFAQTRENYTQQRGDKPGRMLDALGYGEVRVNREDEGKKGYLDRNDVERVMRRQLPGFTEPDIQANTDAWMDARDAFGDGKITVADSAAEIIFRDDPNRYMQPVLKKAAQEGEKSGFTPEEVTATLSFMQGMGERGLETKSDGRITPFERALADMYSREMSPYTRQALENIATSAEFKEQLKAYGQSIQPRSASTSGTTSEDEPSPESPTQPE